MGKLDQSVGPLFLVPILKKLEINKNVSVKTLKIILENVCLSSMELYPTVNNINIFQIKTMIK